MVAFDSVGPSAAGSGGTSPRSYTHTTVASSTLIVVGASLDGVAVGVTATCTIGGVTATSLGQVAANGGTTGIVQAWYLAGVAAGAHTIVVTCSTAADIECGSMAYSGAVQVGTPFTAHSTVTGTTASVGVTASTPGNMIAGFVASGDAVNSTTQTSRWVNNFEGGAGQATGNAAGADAAAASTTVTMSWTVNISPWAVIAVEVQAPPQAMTLALPVLPPGWFPGADRVTTQPGGIPFAPEPGTTDATPAIIIPPTPEAAPVRPVPPGWFPGSEKVTATPNGVPFEPLPPPLTPVDAVIFPVPEAAGIPDWLPLPPGYFPGSQTVTVDPGGIPFYAQPQPLTPPPAPPPVPVITGQAGTGLNAYFQDQNGNPRLYLGAETWGLPANAGRWNGGNWRGDYDFYHTTRAAQGYTANVTHPWGHTHTGCNNDLGHTWDGVFPFLVNGSAADLTGQAGTITLNDPFWQRIDYMFASAAASGITVFFDLSMSNDMPTGAGHGFTNGVFQNASTAQIQAAATAVATRYATTQNLVWFFGDDYYNDDDTDYNAMWTGINAADPRIASCTSIEYYPTGNTARYDLSGAPGGETPHGWGNTHATYNFVYCYMQTYFGIEYAYTEPSPIGPVIWGDGMFWGNGGTSGQNDQLQRNNTWWALASGARGFVAEDETVLQWGSGAAAAMTADGSFPSWIKNIYNLFSGLPGWQKLIPDTGNLFVTAGRGTRAVYSSSEYLANTDNYVAASRVPDGSLAVIYCAQAMSITIDQTKMAPGYTATWADPASGALTATGTGSTYSSSGLGNNSAGGADWVLILQGTPTGTPGGATEAPVIPLAPGWFPGADRVVAAPAGIPFLVPSVPDPGITQVIASGAAALAGAFSVAAPLAIQQEEAGTALAVAAAITAPASAQLATATLLPAVSLGSPADITQGPASILVAGSVTGSGAGGNTAGLNAGVSLSTAAQQLAPAALAAGAALTAAAQELAPATLAAAFSVNSPLTVVLAPGTLQVSALVTSPQSVLIAPATLSAQVSIPAPLAQQLAVATLAAAATITNTARQLAIATLGAAAVVTAAQGASGAAVLSGGVVLTGPQAVQAAGAALIAAGALTAPAARQAATAVLAALAQITANAQIFAAATLPVSAAITASGHEIPKIVAGTAAVRAGSAPAGLPGSPADARAGRTPAATANAAPGSSSIPGSPA